MMHRPVFKDPSLDLRFREEGYVTLPGLSQAEIKRALEFYNQHKPEGLTTMYSHSYAGYGYDFNVNLTSLINSFFSRFVEENLLQYHLSGATYLVKGIGPESVSRVHQDWNNVDENQYLSLSIWCPLTDVNETNGALYMIPGSHRMFSTVRSTTLQSIWLEFDADLEPFLQMVPMKAGEICVYAHNLFHGSKPNSSNAVRVALVSGLMPEGAQFIHYYHRADAKPDESEMLEVDLDFYHRDVPMAVSGVKPPCIRSLGIVKHPVMPITKEQVFEKLRAAKGVSV